MSPKKSKVEEEPEVQKSEKKKKKKKSKSKDEEKPAEEEKAPEVISAEDVTSIAFARVEILKESFSSKIIVKSGYCPHSFLFHFHGSKIVK